MKAEQSKIVAVLSTYRRNKCLLRLIEALEMQSLPVYGLVIADNAFSNETRDLVLQSNRAFQTAYVGLTDNPGCGQGLASAMKRAQEEWGDELTFCIFDDDAVPEVDAVSILYEGMREENAWAAAPMLLRPDGLRDGGPELKSKVLHRALKRHLHPSDARQLLNGSRPEFVWCKGPAMMISAEAVRTCGMHRGDMWMLGEDIEYSMRLSASGKCIFIPEATVYHLPPTGPSGQKSTRKNMVKFLAMLQNLAFMGVRLGHARKCLSYLPAHICRYLVKFRSLRSYGYLIRALWYGLIHCEPAGAQSGNDLRKTIMSKI